MSTPRSWLHHSKLIFAIVLLVLPAGVFYSILWRDAVRIPILDDYDTLVNSMSWMSQHHTMSARFLYVITHEHSGYKLMFNYAIVFCQYILFGQVHFLPLVVFGNAFALFIFLIVLCMSRVFSANTAQKWLLVTPVAWLIFQLQYASALDFASCSLQVLSVVFFSLASIYLLDKSFHTTFAISCIALVLAIASSPNGFFIAPLGVLMLAQKKQWRRVGVLVITTTFMLLLYFYRYTPVPQEVAGVKTGPAEHLNPLYALAFLGSSAARYSSIGPSVALGLLLCGVVVLAAKQKYFRKNPPVFYSMLFIVINGLAVSFLRSDLGVAQSLASRYRVYSNLFLVFTYLFLIETILPKLERKAVRRSLFAVALTVSVAFCCLSDLAGAHFLRGKKQALTFNYRTQWQHIPADQTLTNMDLQSNPALRRQINAGVFNVNLSSLREAASDGVYIPPSNP